MLQERLREATNPSLLAILEAIQAAVIHEPEDDAILIGHLRHQLDLLLARCVGAGLEAGAFEGYASPCQWLRTEALLPTGAAMAVVDVASALGELPLATQALVEGEVGFNHLALVAEARERLGERFEEAKLLKAARRQTVSEFRKTVEHEAHAADPARFAAGEAEAREHRFLHLSPQDDGSAWLKGWLEPEAASIFRAAVEPLARLKGRDDRRLRDQRLGDALVELAGRGVKAELIVSMPLETFLGAKGAPAAESEWGGILSSEAVQRLLCEAGVRRLVLDAEGEVLDLGRARRLFSPAQRTAIAARDGHCVFRSCDRPPRWCEAHHVDPVAGGGETKVSGGVLLCTRHHRYVHERGWKVVRDGSQFRTIPPIAPVHRRPPPVLLN